MHFGNNYFPWSVVVGSATRVNLWLIFWRQQIDLSISDDHFVFSVSDKKPHQSKKGEPDPHINEWALRACHRCLVYLGDIARYQQDYDGMRSKMLAQRYYYEALALFPDLGK